MPDMTTHLGDRTSSARRAGVGLAALAGICARGCGVRRALVRAINPRPGGRPQRRRDKPGAVTPTTSTIGPAPRLCVDLHQGNRFGLGESPIRQLHHRHAAGAPYTRSCRRTKKQRPVVVRRSTDAIDFKSYASMRRASLRRQHPRLHQGGSLRQRGLGLHIRPAGRPTRSPYYHRAASADPTPSGLQLVATPALDLTSIVAHTTGAGAPEAFLRAPGLASRHQPSTADVEDIQAQRLVPENSLRTPPS